MLAFVAQTFNNGFVMLNYYMNTAAFAKDCVNKAKPKMHCNGKCQMMKKLQQEEKNDQQMPERKLEKKLEMISHSALAYPVNFSTPIISNITVFEKNYPLATASNTFFHPPRV